jgi:hypothetical protein
MRIMSNIEDGEIIKAILKHLGLFFMKKGLKPLMVLAPHRINKGVFEDS